MKGEEIKGDEYPPKRLILVQIITHEGYKWHLRGKEKRPSETSIYIQIKIPYGKKLTMPWSKPSLDKEIYDPRTTYVVTFPPI